MVLEGYRERVAPYIQRVSTPFLGWAPARISLLALMLAAAAALFAALARWFGPDLFLPVALLIFFSGFFDVVDGEVARRTGRTSKRGDFVDHVFDRYADVALLIGIGVSSFAIPALALLALVSLLLTSYMGTQAQAVGVGRAYGGLLTRADRLLILAGATFLEFDLSLPWPWARTAPWSHFVLGGLVVTVIDAALVYFVVAGQLTAVARGWSVYRQLPVERTPPPP